MIHLCASSQRARYTCSCANNHGTLSVPCTSLCTRPRRPTANFPCKCSPRLVRERDARVDVCAPQPRAPTHCHPTSSHR
jgi:hypothetical protein